jgi:predicted phage terminase large subunit-like protein
MSWPNFQFADFIKPAFADKSKYTIIRAWRRVWKTYGAFQWILYKLIKNPWSKWLWVDTIQSNLKKYIERYVKEILWDFRWSIKVDNQSYIITFMNGSILDLWSAERPENLEWFEYDYAVLNEAWIILKKEWLWGKTIQPMLMNAQVKIVWTPKGKTDHLYYELSSQCKISKNWTEYHYTCYDSPFINKEELQNIKDDIAGFLWLQEYMAEFVDVYENSLVESEWLRYYGHIDINDFDKLYMHCDTTHTGKTTSDFFCALILWENKKDKNYYIIDFILEKLDVEKQARKTIILYSQYQERIKKLTYDEKANQGFGFWIKKLAKEEYSISLPIEELKYPNDKIQHFTPHIPHFKSNRIYLPSEHQCINLAKNQLIAFPEKWINDDFVDGLSGVLDNFHIWNKNKKTPLAVIKQ